MSVLGGGSSKWTDLGSLTFLTDQANNLAVEVHLLQPDYLHGLPPEVCH